MNVVVGLALVVVARVLVVRRRRARAQRRQRAQIPDLVDLFGLAAAAGHPPWAAVLAVRSRAPIELRPVLEDLVAEVERGARTGDALRRAGERLGAAGRPLTDALAVAVETGAPLGPILDRVATSARVDRRQQGQERARRLPVLLLVPLVCCILPALILLSVVPLLAGSLAALRH